MNEEQPRLGPHKNPHGGVWFGPEEADYSVQPDGGYITVWQGSEKFVLEPAEIDDFIESLRLAKEWR